jgi:Na+/H+ antiporter NhaD/arsenite permease-like protein
MDYQVALMLLLLTATFVVFALELLPLEVTAFSLLGALIALDLVSVTDALSGFSNRAVVAIGALLVLSYALGKAGLIEYAADRVGALAERSRWIGIAVLLIGISVLSGILNNTAIVAVFNPLAIGLSARLGISPSKLRASPLPAARATAAARSARTAPAASVPSRAVRAGSGACAA